MPMEFKKEQKDLYQPKTAPSVIDVKVAGLEEKHTL
jgi:hypothetical protein